MEIDLATATTLITEVDHALARHTDAWSEYRVAETKLATCRAEVVAARQALIDWLSTNFGDWINVVVTDPDGYPH